MHSEGQLRSLVLQHLVDGRLPFMVPRQVAAGYGSGLDCAACDQAITSAEVEYEVKDERNGGCLHLHRGCHFAWQLECTRSEPLMWC